MTIYTWGFQSAMHSEPVGRYRCPKLFECCAKLLLHMYINYDEHVHDLVIRSLVISVILQDGSTTMTTCLHSYSIPVLGHQNHDKAQADKMRCMGLDINYLGSNIIMVTTVTSNK